METWLLLTIVGCILAFLFLILANAIIIVAEKRIHKRDEKIRQLEKDNKHKQELIDAYGIKEITIGGEEDE